MKFIRLNTGSLAVVDDEDFEWLNKWRWRQDERGYAFRRPYKGSIRQGKVMMHRLIMGYPSSYIDHKNGCTIDNRKCNLRLCTNGQNISNSRLRKDNSTGFKGVSKEPRMKNGWYAQISINGKCIRLGTFRSPEEAAGLYCTAALEFYGEFARFE